MTQTTTKSQGTILKYSQDTHLLTWVGAFLIDRKAQGLSPGTLEFYHKKLKLFTDYCEAQLINQIPQITPNQIRLYLLYLDEKGHNPGGIHAAYRTIRTFLYWWEAEIEPEGWKNPIRKVNAPKLPEKPLDPVNFDDINALLNACQRRTFHGDRDIGIIMTLMDTGVRAQELLNMNLDDVDLVTGAVLIRQGKGAKPRTVYLGKKSRKALRAYLRHQNGQGAALWAGQNGERLTYGGLRSLIRRRAIAAGVKAPSLHSFRRYFALSMLRAGVDIFSLQKLMGHADLQVLRRYLAQTDQDTLEAHRRGGPVDNAGW